MKKPLGTLGGLRFWYWRNIRRYPCELCLSCGRPVNLIWAAPDELWRQVVGDPYTVVCSCCFDRLALRAGLLLRWVPHTI